MDVKSSVKTLAKKNWLEDIEYEQVKLDSETIDDIFAEVEDIEEMPIISIDSEDKKE